MHFCPFNPHCVFVFSFDHVIQQLAQTKTRLFRVEGKVWLYFFRCQVTLSMDDIENLRDTLLKQRKWVPK